jgi:hypothetical protein
MRFTTGPSLWHVAISALAGVSNAHFVLQIPTSIGYTSALEGTAPCGSYSPTDRSKGVTNWPLGGSAVKVLTTHSHSTWDFKIALLSNTASWIPVTRVLDQSGVGYLCEPQIPGLAAWVNQDAVLQVIQHATDGDLYQVWLQRHPLPQQPIVGQR